MKKLLLSLSCVFVLGITIAQVPYKFNFQAVVRYPGSSPLPPKEGKLTAEIYSSQTGSSAIWTETHNNIKTNQFGQLSVEIGSVNQTLQNVPWATGNKYLRVKFESVSPDPPANYFDNDNNRTQLISVPFALLADSANGARNSKWADFATSAGTAQTAQSANNVVQEWAYFTEEKPSGEHAGGCTGGQWHQRFYTLKEKFPTTGVSSISEGANEVSLKPGTYKISAKCPAYGCDKHKIKFSELATSLNGPLLFGTSEYASFQYNAASSSVIEGIITLFSNKTFRLWHWTETSNPDDGMGTATGNGDKEIYTSLFIQKIK